MAKLDFTITIAGEQITGSDTETGTAQQTIRGATGPGAAVTLCAGTTNRTLTIGSHTITTDDKVSLFWTDGDGLPQLRCRVTVTAVGATTITVTAASGSGATFPANSTAGMVASIETPKAFALPIAGLAFFAAYAKPLTAGGTPAGRGAAILLDATGNVLLAANLAPEDGCFWPAGDVPAPFEDDIASMAIACGSSTVAANLFIAAEYTA